MMKWKVVKNPRSSSADRSLECLRNDVQQHSNNSNGNIVNGNNDVNSDTNNNNNNNTTDGESKQDNNNSAVKETNRNRDSSLVRKPSVAATECINLRSILGLTRQRSETNLSNLGHICTEPRRSRSEVRGVSCDRLTVGYHTAPGKPLENGKTRSSSPPARSGWLIRGRKRERESRNPVKNNDDAFGKTVVTGSNRRSSKTRNGDCRTIVDAATDAKQKNKLCSVRCSLDSRKCKGRKRSEEEDIIEEEIYCEINNESNNVRGKLLDENREVFKDPTRVIRKKGQAPKPQVTTVLFKDAIDDANNLKPNCRKMCESPVSLNEVINHHPPLHRKPPRKNQTYNGRNHQDKNPESRATQSVKINNLKNNERDLLKAKNSINLQPVVVAEVHKEANVLSCGIINKNKNVASDQEIDKNTDVNNVSKLSQPKETFRDLAHSETDTKDESLPFYIDTPDYSTLDSVNCNSQSLSTEDITLSKDDVVNCNTDCDESLMESSPLVISEDTTTKPSTKEVSLSSILRDSSNDNKESEPKKTVRFEKLDLIEKYKKSKTENGMDTTEDDFDDTKSITKNTLDINSNEICLSNEPPCPKQPQEEDLSHDAENPAKESVGDNINGVNSMTVKVVVRNPSPAPLQEILQNDEPPNHFVVKKSFVLTVAKQEKGFRSLCATKKPEVVPEPLPNPDQQQQHISVTFLCSGPPSEGWMLPSPPGDHQQRLRSISVPPQSLQPVVEVVTALPAIRGRSRERRSKERQHCKKNHKARKKDAVFVMPQAVIDELSQVLEKRKPSSDEISPLHPQK